MRLRLGNKHHLRKPADRKAQISSVSGTNAFLICAFRSADFLRWCLFPKRNLTHYLFFYFQFIFSIFSARKKNGAAGNSIVCFAASIPCQSRHLTVRRMRTVSTSAFLATESVNSAPIKRGETEVQIFWQGKAQNSSPILRCTFLARRSAKLIANFSATMVTSLPSLSLYLSLSLSIALSHRMYLTHNIGNASAFPIILAKKLFISIIAKLHACTVYSVETPLNVKKKKRKVLLKNVWPKSLRTCQPMPENV